MESLFASKCVFEQLPLPYHFLQSLIASYTQENEVRVYVMMVGMFSLSP